MTQLLRILKRVFFQGRTPDPTPDEALSSAERELLRETLLLVAGIILVGVVLVIAWATGQIKIP